MMLFVIHCSFMDNSYFGAYSTIKRARIAFEHFCQETPEIIGYTDIGNYCYEIETIDGAIYGASIETDILDYEFNNDIINHLEG